MPAVSIHMEEKSWTLEDFTLLEKLGEGKAARVFKAIEKRSQKTVALKFLEKQSIVELSFIHQIRREVEIQHHLHYKHILKLFGYFITPNDVVLVIEYVGGRSLFSIVSSKIELKETKIRKILYQLSKAIAYMHLRGVIHRDIKLENVLLDSSEDVKVIDFGWSVHCPKENELRNTFCGTVPYLSPEAVAKKSYDKAVDVWALGILGYELYFGSLPFFGEDKKRTFEKISKDRLKFPKPLRLDAEHFLRSLLCKDQQKRPKIEEVLKQKYFQELRDAEQSEI